jgi:hypothetical protein
MNSLKPRVIWGKRGVLTHFPATSDFVSGLQCFFREQHSWTAGLLSQRFEDLT